MIPNTANQSLSPVSGTPIYMTGLDLQHKRDFETFVLAEQNGPMRECCQELYEKWHAYNRDYFEEKLVIPTYVLLGTPTKPSVLGQYSTVSSFGGTSEIRIRPTLFTGKHPSINANAPMEGRKRFLFDVLLHEMIHQYAEEILGKPEDSFHGHGPVFRDECNRISAIMGITALVRSCKKRGKDKDLPSCAQWPHNVRPDGYYLGAWIEKIEVQRLDPEPDPPEEPKEVKMTVDDILSLIRETLSFKEQSSVCHRLMVEGDNPPGWDIFLNTLQNKDKLWDGLLEAYTPEDLFVTAQELSNFAHWNLETKFQYEYPDDYEKRLDAEIDRLETLVGER